MDKKLNFIPKEGDIKNKIIKIMLVIIYIFSFLVLGGFVFSVFNDKNEFYIMNESNVVVLGNEYQVELIKKHGEISDYSDYEWVIKDQTIATVDEYGLITALSEGVTELKVKSKKGYKVKVMQLEVKNMEVASISFNENVSLEVSEVYKLNPVVNGKSNLNNLLLYESSNPNVVQVDSSGIVTAIGEGEAIIKAYSNNIVAECKIIVKAKKENYVQNIKFGQTTISIKVGTKTKLTPIIEPFDLSGIELVWNSNNDVVSVDKNGNISANKIGQAVVTVQINNGPSTICTINVTDNDVPVGEIRFEKNSYTIDQGDELSLYAIISPNNATNRELKWTSSDASIAKVENGKVTGLKAGTATITVKTSNGKIATSKVTVNKKNTIVNASGIKLNITSKKIYIGESFDLTETISPSNTTNKNVTWTSSDASIAKVENGKVTGLKAGTATITVKTSNGKTETCKVTVSKKNIAASSVKLNLTSTSINIGDELNLTATVSPSDATNKNITWSSNDTSIAKVENGKVTGLKSGTATITAKTHNGKTATCKVTVSKKTTAASSVKLNLTTKSIYVGDNFTLTVTVSPSDATNKNITWSSNDTSIAKVENGKVTGLKAGTATITAKTHNGKTATCKVTVSKKTTAASSVKLNLTTKSIYVGDNFTLTATVSPSDATNKNITWSSNDTSIAKVENGKVTGLKSGTATITAKTHNGKTATCKVTVNKKSSTIEVTGVSLNLTTKSIYVGEAFNLTATVSPSNATNKNIIWSSSDSSIARIENGKVTGLKAGTATITVKTNNGKTSTSKVTVIKNTFTNPIRGGADPWMIQKDGYYYTTYTNGRKEIVIYKSKKLHDFAKNGKTVYVSDFNTSNKGIWAPELHYLNGKWYIYYADTTDGQTSNRRMHVLESKTQDPQGEYVYKGIIARGHQAIDGTVLNWNNQLYFLWSGREPKTTPTQRIYIAKMSDPWTITGDIVMIASPQYSWEKQAGPVNEGPQVLIKNGTLHIIYSASGASSTGYCFGLLTYKGSGSLLNASNWTKTSTPIFKAGNSVYGPGHGSFVKSPDGKEDWVVYHAYTKPEDAKNWNRNIRVQKFTWNGNIPNFGTPVATGSEITIPSGTKY